MSDIFEFIKTIFDNHEKLTILEVGAADGNDTMKILNIFDNCDLFCLEPDPRGFELHKKYVTNDRCKIFNLAISDNDGEAEFKLSNKVPDDVKLHHKAKKPWYDGNVTRYDVFKEATKIFTKKLNLEEKNDTSYGWLYSSTLSETKKNDSAIWSHKINVKTKKLDTFCKEQCIREIDFLWTDVEGAEVKLLKGAKETLKLTKYIMLECNNNRIFKSSLTDSESVSLMKMYNFTNIYQSDDKTNIIFKNNNY